MQISMLWLRVCRKQHSFTLSQDSLGALSGVHTGAITKAPASGSVQGQSFTLRSELPSPGGVLPFVFTGVLCSTAEGGEPLALEGTLQCPAQAATAPSGGAAETAGEAEWCLHAQTQLIVMHLESLQNCRLILPRYAQDMM